MRNTYLKIFLLLCIIFSLKQSFADTITNWQIYKDSELLIAANETMEISYSTDDTIDITSHFKNIKIDFFYDFYMGDIEREIGIYYYGEKVCSLKKNAYSYDPIVIPKEFLLRNLSNFSDGIFEVRYNDNKFSKDLCLGFIYFKNTAVADQKTSLGYSLGYGSGFHQFITSFGDKQYEKIIFPLLVINEGDTNYSEEEDWQVIDQCLGCEYSPILFMNDTINRFAGYYCINDNDNYIISVYIKASDYIQDLHFVKINDKWMLSKVIKHTVIDPNGESFFKFITRFAVDADFVESRITDDFQYLEREMGAEQEYQKKGFVKSYYENQEYLFKRIYIFDYDMSSNEIQIWVKGEGTCYNTRFYFKRIDKKWYFCKEVSR